MGRFALVSDVDPKFIYSPQLCFWRSTDTDVIDPIWLHYWLQGPEASNQINALKSQTDMADYVSLRDQRGMTITLPSRQEQKLRSHSLSLLDAKIDLLRQQNETLEALGAAVFREWFLEGEERSELLGDFIVNSKENVKVPNIDPRTPYIAMEHLEKEHISVYSHGLGKDVNSNKAKFSTGDILFGKLRPYFHKIGVPNFDGVCSTDILVFKPIQRKHYGFVLFCIHTDDFINYCTQGSGGTRMPRVSFNTIKKYPIPFPDTSRIDNFDIYVKSLLEKVHNNVDQIHRLTSTRDLLLPKLMSGQVKVRADG